MLSIVMHGWFETLPLMLSNTLQNLQIQPSETEAPLSGVAVGAFEVGTLGLVFGIDIPTTTSFVRNEWKLVEFLDSLDKGCVLVD